MLKSLAFIAAVFATPAIAAQCGNDASGFDRWKSQFSQEAAAQGVGQ